MTTLRATIGSALPLLLVACGPKPLHGDSATSTTSGHGSTDGGSTTGGAPTTGDTGHVVSSSTTMSAATSDATSATAGTDSSGRIFLGGLDQPIEPMPMECDPHVEMPCPEGQKCSAAAPDWYPGAIYLGTPACFPILGDKQKGEPCDFGRELADGLDDCGAGTLCVDIHWTGGMSGQCVDFCDPPVYDGTPPSCSDPTEFCYSPACQECQLSICVPACDPLAPDCPAGTSCVLSVSWPEHAFDCEVVQPDLPQVGEPCDGFYKCMPGSHCVLAAEVTTPACAGFEACCTPLCDMTAPNTCPGQAMGETCQPFYPEPFDPIEDPWGVQYNKLGLCKLP